MNRRVFLRGIGGAAVAAPFLSSVNEKKAKGAAASQAKRLVIFYTHNGCLTDRWFPKVTSGAFTADSIKGMTLEPLTPYINKILVPRGFRSMNQYGSGQSIDPHDQAMGSKLTCATIDDANKRYATATSLDHVIAKQINPGGKTPLVLSVGGASTSIKEILSFQAPGMPFPAIVNPLTVYNQLTSIFGTTPTTTPTGAGGAGGTPTTPQADYHVARGMSAIDLVRGDLYRYQAQKMSKDDQNRISDWLDLLRSTENGMMNMGMMGTGTGSGTTLTASCTKGTAEAAPFNATMANVSAASPTGKITLGSVLGNTPNAEGDKNLATSFTLGGDMMFNLMALNMICDVNRVFVMPYPGYVTFNWDGIMHMNEHHGLSHRTGDFSVGGACGVDGVLDKIQQIDSWYAGKFAKLVGLFDGIKEGSGTLLDNTATMWLQELSDGATHNLNNLPILIAGGCGGYLKTGQVVNVDKGTPDPGKSTSTCQNGGNIGYTGSSGGVTPINKLYVTLMNALGCTADGTPTGGKVTTFGAFDGTGTTGGITNPGEVAALTTAG